VGGIERRVVDGVERRVTDVAGQQAVATERLLAERDGALGRAGANEHLFLHVP
jgi:hypothetical protein